MKIFSYILIFFSLQGYGQEVKGYLYDSNGKIHHNIIIKNITQKLNSASEENGSFRIAANVQDTIVFNSILYEEHRLVIDRKHLNSSIVVELKNATLEEVKIRSHNFKKTPIEDLDKNLTYTLRQDISKNPSFYEPHKGNVLYLLQDALGLFKNKKEGIRTDRPKEKKIISYDDFKVLFKDDGVLNRKFLLEDLSIPQKYHSLFFEFLVSKKINSSYLEKKKKLDLINVVYKAGKEYKDNNQLFN